MRKREIYYTSTLLGEGPWCFFISRRRRRRTIQGHKHGHEGLVAGFLVSGTKFKPSQNVLYQIGQTHVPMNQMTRRSRARPKARSQGCPKKDIDAGQDRQVYEGNAQIFGQRTKVVTASRHQGLSQGLRIGERLVQGVGGEACRRHPTCERLETKDIAKIGHADVPNHGNEKTGRNSGSFLE